MSGEKYYPIYLQRSDGQGYLNDAENSDPVGQKDERLTRWRAVIGSHIKYQLDDDPTDKRLFILASLPDGYELREIKSGKTANVYLFGHPSNARYRTAGEFVPHVLWLMSDSVDRNDCFCTPCMELVRRESRQVSASTTPVQQHLPQPSNPTTAKPVSQGAKAGDASAQQQVQQVQQPQQQPQQAQHQYQPAQATQQQAAPPSSTEMGISSPSNIFRLAELVWFKDRAWRLGIILSISRKPTTSPHNPTFDDHNYIFTMAPLGHSIFRKPNQAKEASEMRPFLTFSVPDSPEYKTQPFSAIDWVAETEKRRQAAAGANNPQKNAQDMEYFCLEASKVAARTINNCFSLFNKQVDRVQGGSGFSMEFYSGVFLGAEMIVVGDPVRVTPPPKVDGDEKPTTVMRVDDIVLLVPHARNHAVNLQFRGTVYHLTRLPETQIDASSAGETHGGPFAEEVDYRNALLDAAGRQQAAGGKWTWQAIEKPALRNDDGIHGRFYVSHKLVQILHPDTWQATMREGGAPSMLNTRQHNGGGVPYAGRVVDRRTGVGASITEGVLSLPGGIRE